MGLFGSKVDEKIGFGKNLVWGQYIVRVVIYDDDFVIGRAFDSAKESDKIMSEVNPLIQSSSRGDFNEFCAILLDKMREKYDNFELEIIENTTNRIFRYSRRM